MWCAPQAVAELGPRRRRRDNKMWRRRADSNRGVEVLQTSALATWLRRPDGGSRSVDVRLERETGFEPATPTLARSCSTTDLFPRPTRRGYHDQGALAPS